MASMTFRNALPFVFYYVANSEFMSFNAIGAQIFNLHIVLLASSSIAISAFFPSPIVYIVFYLAMLFATAIVSIYRIFVDLRAIYNWSLRRLADEQGGTRGGANSTYTGGDKEITPAHIYLFALRYSLNLGGVVMYIFIINVMIRVDIFFGAILSSFLFLFFAAILTSIVVLLISARNVRFARALLETDMPRFSTEV